MPILPARFGNRHLAACFISLVLPASAELHRGVWFWGSTTLPDATSSPFGSIAVVGTAAAEDETITFFGLHGVKRVYGSYQNRPVSETSVIAAWNTKLDVAGISSQLLIDGVDVDLLDDVPSILTKITNRLISFNAAVTPASQFDALHLDLEPQGSDEWSDALPAVAPAVKRGLLQDLYNAYGAIRDHLDDAGLTAMPIYADIPYTWDKLPVDGGSIGWADAADRDAWFADIAGVLDGISIMTFSKDTFPEVDTATSYERSGALTGKARVGIQPKCGPAPLLWPTILHFNSVMNECEAAYGPTGATDLENYAFWRHGIATTLPSVGDPIIATLGGSGGALPWGTSGGVIIFDGLPGFLYTVRHGTDPGQITQEITSVRTTTDHDAEILKVPVTASGPRGFWRVERMPDE